MQLTEDQKKCVTGWIADGDGLAEVQRKILSEFEISMTYMDVRFLVDDLGVTPADVIIPEPKVPQVAPEAGPAVPIDDSTPLDPEVSPLPGGGGVSLDIDPITRPGAVVSGSVTFSDGVTAAWELDSTGRLAVKAPQDGYQPSQEDIQTFQQQLGAALRNKGF